MIFSFCSQIVACDGVNITGKKFSVTKIYNVSFRPMISFQSLYLSICCNCCNWVLIVVHDYHLISRTTKYFMSGWLPCNELTVNLQANIMKVSLHLIFLDFYGE